MNTIPIENVSGTVFSIGIPVIFVNIAKINIMSQILGLIAWIRWSLCMSQPLQLAYTKFGCRWRLTGHEKVFMLLGVCELWYYHNLMNCRPTHIELQLVFIETTKNVLGVDSLEPYGNCSKNRKKIQWIALAFEGWLNSLGLSLFWKEGIFQDYFFLFLGKNIMFWERFLPEIVESILCTFLVDKSLLSEVLGYDGSLWMM